MPLDVLLNIRTETRALVSYYYINGVLNESASYSYNLNIELTKNKKDKYNLSVSVGPGYSVNQFSLHPQNDNNAGGFNSTTTVRFFLPGKFQIESDFRYSYIAKTNIFPAQSRALWNASLSKTFLKADNLKLSISGNDLLNQNQIFNRTISGNAIIQSSSSTIKRFFMISASWDFTRFGMLPAKN